MDLPPGHLSAGSGRDSAPRSTVLDVLCGVDLSGKLAIVSGGSSGLGLETTRALAGAGARVILPARRRAEAETALPGLGLADTEGLEGSRPRGSMRRATR
jgi:hypothetical protein